MAAGYTVTCRCVTAFVVAASVFVLFLVCVGGIVTIVTVFEEDKSDNFTEYGIVIDAGSAHTTLWIFSWNGTALNHTGNISSYDLHEGKSQGIDSYASDPNNVSQSLIPLMNYANSTLGDLGEPRVSLHLGATAGMRILYERNKSAANNILEAVKNYFSDHGYPKRNVSIISGTVEAVGSWASINYLHKTLENREDASWGSIDFGGKSLEITAEHNGSDSTSVTFFDHDYKLYSHSFLCCGRDSMEMRLFELLIRNATDMSNISNPCLPIGYNVSVSQNEIWQKPCWLKSPGVNDVNYTFVGTSNATQCLEYMGQLFDNSTYNDTQYVCRDYVTSYKPKGYFYGIGLLYSILKEVYQVPDLATDINWKTFNGAINKICSYNVTTLENMHPGPLKYVSRYCFDGVLIYKTLTEGLQFKANSSANLKMRKEIENIPLGWTLGYMLNETKYLSVPTTPYSEDPPFTELDLILSVILLSIVAVILFLLFLALGRVCMLMVEKNNKGYSSID